MTFFIKDIVYELGEIKLSTDSLISQLEISDLKKVELKERVGTDFIYESGPQTDFFSLSTKCVLSLLRKNSISEDGLGIIFVTQSNSQIIPAEGQRVKHACGLPESVFVLDLNIGCSGFVYALFVATSILKTSHLKNIIIVAGDTYRKFIDPEDRSTSLLFSDAVSGTLVNSEGSTEILEIDFGGNGANYNDISLLKNFDHSKNVKFKMDGAKVFSFTNSVIPSSIDRTLLRSSKKVSDISLFFFHQASGIVLQTLKSKLNLTDRQVPETLTELGNTGSASIPITLSKCLSDDSVKIGDHLLLSGFGIGLSYGTMILKW